MGNPRDVNLDVVAHDKTDKATRSVEGNLDRIERRIKAMDDSSRRASKSVAEMTSKLDKTNTVDKFSKGVDKAAGDLLHLAAGAAAVLPALGALQPIVIGLVSILAPASAALAIYGAVFSSVFARINDETAKSDPNTRRAAESLDRLKKAWTAFVDRNAPRVVDAMTKAFDTLTGVIPKLQPLFDTGAAAVERFLGYVESKFQDGTVDRFIDFLSQKAPGALRDVTRALEVSWGAAQTAWEWWGKLSSAVSRAVDAIRVWVLGMKLTWQQVLSFMYKESANFLRATAEGFGKLPGIGAKVREALTEAANGLDASAYVARQKAAQIQAAIDKIHGKSVTVTVNTHYTTSGSNKAIPTGGRDIAFSGGRSFAFADPGAGGYRSAPPTPVTVSAPEVNNSFRVEIDGTPLRAMIREEIGSALSGSAFRARFGRR